jgi:pantothenate kinase-related protein Tda10
MACIVINRQGNGTENLMLSKLWSAIALAKQNISKKSSFIIGITGPPGVGKTTTARIITEVLSSEGFCTHMASLEDFYLPEEDRKALGIKWRASPGSHDTQKLISILRNIKARNSRVLLPRYDMASDCILPSSEVKEIIDCFVLEGWLLKTHIEGYKEIASYIDFLIYLDTEVTYAKKWRFQREESFRKTLGFGYSEEQMIDFWESVLEPGIYKWVIPQKTQADLILCFDNNHDIL